jgi:hypothetical protein
MKAIVLAFVLVCAALAYGCISIFPSLIVKHAYPTLADARRDELFGKGWLPDILPPSTHAIRTENNLDLNISSGEFRIAPHEMPLFEARLKRGAAETRFNDWKGTIEEYADDGYIAWTYRQEGDAWTFFCKADVGHCDYYLDANP